MYQFILRFMLFVAVHSILAVPVMKNRIAAMLGRYGYWYRLGYNVLALLLFFWVMLAWPHSRVIYFIPGIWGLFCYPLQICVLILLCRCAAQLDIVEFLGLRRSETGNEPARLIQSGCYGRVRHPQYTLAIVFLALNPVMTGRWLALRHDRHPCRRRAGTRDSRILERAGSLGGQSIAEKHRAFPCVVERITG